MCRTEIITRKIIWQGILVVFLVVGLCVSSASAIDVELTSEQAKQIMATARGVMGKASSNEEMFTIIRAADKKARIGDNPETNPCGSSAISVSYTHLTLPTNREV